MWLAGECRITHNHPCENLVFSMIFVVQRRTYFLQSVTWLEVSTGLGGGEGAVVVKLFSTQKSISMEVEERKGKKNTFFTPWFLNYNQGLHYHWSSNKDINPQMKRLFPKSKPCRRIPELIVHEVELITLCSAMPPLLYFHLNNAI